jgi:DnaB-like helicase C terminal domain
MRARFCEVVADSKFAQEGPCTPSYGLSLLRGCPSTPGTLIVVGGRTGAGKSFFGLSLLNHSDARGAYVSLEDPPAEVGRRIQAMPAKRLQEIALIVPARPRLSMICAEIAQAFEEGFCPRIVVIDYIQLIQYDGESAAWSQTDQIGLVLAELKALAREHGFVLVVMCQLRRPMRESAGDGYESFPCLWDLRDSSNLENSAEVVVLLQAHEEELEARVAKNKAGRTGVTQWFARGAHGFLTPIVREDRDLFGDPAPVVLDLFDERAAAG